MTKAPDQRLSRRAYVRRKIFQPVSLAVAGVRARAHMLDVSAGGARVHATADAQVGADVTLQWADQPRRGRIVWRDGNRCGIAFAVPLNQHQLAALLAG